MGDPKDVELGRLQLLNHGHHAVLKLDNSDSLNLYIGESFTQHAQNVTVDENAIVASFDDAKTKLVISLRKDDNFEFYNFAWFTPLEAHYLKDTVYLGEGEAHWFGGPQLLQQAWPILNTREEKKGYDFCPYVIEDPYMKPSSGFERYWLGSQKVALIVPSGVPLWTQLSPNGYLALQAQYADSPYALFPQRHSDEPYLSYTLAVPVNFKSTSLPDFHVGISKIYFDHPHAVFDEKLIEKPIWTTWARYGKAVTQADVTKYADEIVSRGFPVSQIELDDKWTTEYGDFEIDTNKFPDFPALIAHLKSKDLRLTTWVHPFVNVESESAKNPKLQDFFVKGSHGKPETVHWWNGDGYAIDFTNPKAYNWYKSKLEAFQKVGIFTYKFDAGEVYYLPEGFKLASGKHPNDYSRDYARLAAEFGTAVENRVGNGTQAAPILIRTLDRASQWTDTGLQTLIPSVLQFSLLGYYWNLPDIIGGNGFNISQVGDRSIRTDSELFIRWVQVNAFLLVLQFSFCPWDYQESDKVVEITKSVLKQRDAFVPYIKSQCHAAVANGVPVIRPLWWALSSKEALTVDDQFLVGDRLLVAPIAHENTYHRRVLLPEGSWKDDLGNVHIGPITIETDVPLERIPHYWRQDRKRSWIGSIWNMIRSLFVKPNSRKGSEVSTI
uniref:Gal_mutarotas_2 domain-containing protein n=1 Tax=Panagrellus redivivus TaxID=6233 RepID=A0A7E4VAK9_PANRE